MTPGSGSDRTKQNSPKRGPPGVSQDRKNDLQDARHHPADHARPHQPHHPRHKVTGATRHRPHTQPEEQALNIDHGTHEDRPRPGKIAKKGRRV